MIPPDDRAQSSPSASRNRGPILDVLRAVLREDASVLEIASGTGEHSVWFCNALPRLRWQPSDRDQAALDSIAAWRAHAGLANLLPPLKLDAAIPEEWPELRADAVVAINLLHISPWAATRGLVQGAAKVLEESGLLLVYGAFREKNVPLANSNLAFDADLRARNAEWGLRNDTAVAEEAERAGLTLLKRVEMPARNLILLFGRGPPALR